MPLLSSDPLEWWIYSTSKLEHLVSPVSAVSLCDYDHSVTLRSHISIEVLTICNFACNMAAAFTFHNGPNILHFMPKFFFRENIHLFEEKIHDRKRNGKESILNSQCVSEFMNWFWSFQAACLNRHTFGFLWRLELGKGLAVWLFRYGPPLSLSPLQKPELLSFLSLEWYSILFSRKIWRRSICRLCFPVLPVLSRWVCLLSKASECWAREACDKSNIFKEKSRTCLTEQFVVLLTQKIKVRRTLTQSKLLWIAELLCQLPQCFCACKWKSSVFLGLPTQFLSHYFWESSLILLIQNPLSFICEYRTFIGFNYLKKIYL